MNIGTIVAWGSNTIPDNWLLCDGSAVSRTTYADLFAVIGTNFGTGDGSTTFNLPNLKGKVPVGQDTSDTSFDVLGETGGEKTHTLTVGEMPNHNHSLGIGTPTTGGSTYTTSGGVHRFNDNALSWAGSGGTFHVPNLTTWNGTNSVSKVGGGQAHNILQPYIVTNYIIKALVDDKVKISELESATNIDGTELIPIVQSGVTKKMTTDNLLGNIEADISNIQDNIDNILDGEIYSTNEVKTNKVWIDGKPIYRKVISLNNFAISDNVEYNHNIGNIDTIVYTSGITYVTTSYATMSYPTISHSGAALNYYVTRTQILFGGTDSWSANQDRYHVFTIEYTKTTD